MGSSASGWALVAGSCEHNNEPSGSIMWWALFDEAMKH